MALQKDLPSTANTRRHSHKRRRDAGSSRTTSRDVDVLRLGAEQTFVRYDTVGEYLAPGYTPATAEPSADQLADPTPPAKRAWPGDQRHRLMAVSHLMNKLEARGSIEILKPWSDQPAWFRVRAQGLRVLGLDWEDIPFPSAYQDQEARLRHDRYFCSHHHVINQIRMLLARGGANMPPEQVWRGERAIEQALPPREPGVRRPHKADGIISLNADGSWPIEVRTRESPSRKQVVGTVSMQAGQLIAIEAECTQKNDERLAEILSDLLAHHDFVWYFCRTETIRQAVSRARKNGLSTDAERRRVRLLLLEEYLPCL